MKFVYITLFLLSISILNFAQLPNTEIWVFDLKPGRNGYAISNPTKIKIGNGYNNQPYFTQDGEELYFVSNGKKGGKTDIYKYRFKKKRRKIKRLTRTKKESEYSPMLTPDRTKISCVRVAADSVTQNLCTYNLKGKKANILFPGIKTFGYYCWKSQIDLLAFHVPEPFTFKKHNFPYKKHDSLGINISRCIVNNRGKIFYVDKTDSTKWQIKELNKKRIGNRKYKFIPPDSVISKTIPGAEDFAFIRGRDLVMAKDGFIYMKKNVLKNRSAIWEPIFDLNHHKLYNIYRIAVSPIANKIALVVYTDEQS